MGRQANLKSFKPGQSGNPAGRPKGARNRLSEAFLKALADDFEKDGVDAIAKVRGIDPAAYLRVCASLLPKDLNVTVNPLERLTDDELAQRAAALVGTLGADRVAQLLRGDGAAPEDQPAGGIPSVH